ncbi:MAG: hypothetical protein J1F24_07235 [Oscillospiraceae bacterium]|nr:hypothetical protein [Oscillospiraceae bacterium]
MEKIIDEAKYNEKVKAFERVYENKSIPIEEKIRLCEEFAYCDYVKHSERIDFAGDLAELYLKAGRYRDVIDFITVEFKTHFKDEDSWWMFIASLLPFYMFYVIDACIALKDYHMAKGFLDALKMNRTAMLRMHQDDGLTSECKYWYARVMTKFVQIAILEGDISTAQDYLLDPFFEDYKNIEAYYYMGIISKGDKDERFKQVSLAITCFTGISELDVNDDNYVDEQVKMIIDSNYYLGLIYATEQGYKNKEKAIEMLNKAKELGYDITDVQINSLTENIENEISKKNGGCYVATCVYGSYDCPQVWTLRRFRDNVLSNNIFGKMFIKLYYTVSPSIVRIFGNFAWFHKLFKTPLDKFVNSLQRKGIDNTPYQDLK